MRVRLVLAVAACYQLLCLCAMTQSCVRRSVIVCAMWRVGMCGVTGLFVSVGCAYARQLRAANEGSCGCTM